MRVCNLLGLILLCLVCGLAAMAKEITTDKVAIARAKEFMSAVGWKETSTPKAKTASISGSEQSWQVTYGSVMKPSMFFVMDKKTGQVQSANNINLFGKLPQECKSPISSAKAREKAKKLLGIAGVPMIELREKDNKLQKETMPPYMGGKTFYMWLVSYERMYRNYPYLTDGVLFAMHPQDASLISLTAFLTTPAPKSLKATVNKDTAIKKAKEALAARKITYTKLESTRLGITRANQGLDSGKEQLKPSNDSYLVWSVTFTRDKQSPVQVWIDAASATLRGGLQPRNRR